MNRIKSDKIILRDRIVSGYVYFDNGIIDAVTDENMPYETEYDYTGKYVSPGFIDIHTHGAGGCDYGETSDSVIKAVQCELKHGATTIYPTIAAAPMSEMRRAVCEIKHVMDNKLVDANIPGIHMEGPYFSAKQAGAQCPDFIKCPDKTEYEPLIEELGDYIARWAYAPENDIGHEFCKYIVSKGMISSAGHTDAIYDDMLGAMDAGCNLITHLYSCTSTITRDHGFRRLGVIETAFLHDDMYVEIIADGKHLPPELIKLILKIKGTDKVALVTDSQAPAGTDAKRGIMGATEYIVEDGVCKLLDRSAFAGSIATADRLVRVIVNEVGESLENAVKMMTAVPAEIMKLNKGELAQGKDADIIVFDDDINVSDVFVMGNKVI